MTDVNPETLPILVIGGVIGALIFYPVGFFHAVWRRAWKDRTGARAGATKAHKAAVALIPKGIRFAAGVSIATVVALIVILNTPEEPAATGPDTAPSATPAGATK